MEHFMKLNPVPFAKIKSGEKQIEYRLNDEKRQQLRIGDIITFSKLPEEDETLSVSVTDLKKYRNLLEMYEASFTQYLYKYYPNPEAVVEDTSYYTDAQVKKDGCLAIHIRKLND